MDEMKPGAYVALLGDLIDSRSAEQRGMLHRTLEAALERANAGPGVVDPLRVTAGDEFQGIFATWGDALAASFSIRLSLSPDAVRFGLGLGEIQVLDPITNIQDGSAWWAARHAIETIESAAKGARRALRTGLAAAQGHPDPGAALLAATGLVDAALHGADEIDLAIVTHLVQGRSQAEAAAHLQVTPSAISQRVARRGWAVLADAMNRLERVGSEGSP